MRSILVGTLVVLVLITAVTPLFAENAGDKLGRGVVNVLTGWLEIPNKISEEAKNSNAVQGLLVGTVKGAGYTVAREGTGALETATFVFPPYDKPMMEPKYAFKE